MIDPPLQSWSRLQHLFDAVLEVEPSERSAWLNSECEDDRELRRELEQLLAVHDRLERAWGPSAAEGKRIDFGVPQFVGAGVNDRIKATTSNAAKATSRFGSSLPRRIGRYSVQRLIAVGGMGTVYEAEQEHPRRTVAVKVMHVPFLSGSLWRRFEHESDHLAKLRHPGIAQVYEADTDDHPAGPVPYFAMEYISGGQPITQYAEKRSLNRQQRLELFSGVCDAVHHAHQRGIIHRDLKPSNLLVDAEGRSKIIDFGLARSTHEETFAAPPQTRAGELVGTVSYMSPEQCAGDPHAIDVRTDVYSLGVVLYELLSGCRPYHVRSVSLDKAVQVIRQQPPTPLCRVDSALGGELEAIVGKALEKDPQRRYQSAAELADDIQRYLRRDAVLARPPSLMYRLRVVTRRNKALVTGIAAVVLALVLGIVGTGLGLVRANRQRAVAEKARRSAERSASESEAVRQFLTRMLASADPYSPEGGLNLSVREVLDKSAEALDEETVFADQPLVKATLHHTIGQVYDNLTLFDQAEYHMTTALDIRRRQLGAEHPATAESLHGLAHTLRWTDRSAKVEPLYRKALAIRRTHYGDQHPQTLETMFRLGEWLTIDWQPEEAEPLLRQVLATQRRVLGENHLDTVRTMMRLGTLLCWQDNVESAEAYFRRALAIRTSALGPEHPNVASSLRALGNNLSEQGELEEAEALLRRALAINRKLGQNHRYAAHTFGDLGKVLLKTGELDEAETLFRTAIERYRRTPNRVRLAAHRGHLGECLTRMGRYSEAGQELKNAFESLHARGRNDWLMRATCERLVSLYEAWEKPKQAARWRARLKNVRATEETAQ